ncbi:hypothetical protein WA158_000908 [Blastocystis sp. Blastoise]
METTQSPHSKNEGENNDKEVQNSILKSAEEETNGLNKAIYHLGDKWIASCGETVKSVAQECCHLGYQLINGTCAVAIELLEEPGYESERRQRITHKKASVSVATLQKERQSENATHFAYKNYFPKSSPSPSSRLRSPITTVSSMDSPTTTPKTEQKKTKQPSRTSTRIALDPREYHKRTSPKSFFGILKRYILILLNYLIEWIRVSLRTFICLITFFLPTYDYQLSRQNEEKNEVIRLRMNPGEIEVSADDIPGLVEDLQMKCFRFIEHTTTSCRLFWSYFINPYNYVRAYNWICHWWSSPNKITELTDILHIPAPSSILQNYLFDLGAYRAPTLQDTYKQDNSYFKNHSLTKCILGFPLEEYTVHTVDGYCLVLFRIPSPNTKRIIYLQHGVMDTAFAWISNTSSSSLATLCYEQGYDVFFGSFRGTDGHYQSGRTKHESLQTEDPEYWHFCIDDFVLDWEAFIHAILVIKERERLHPDNYMHKDSGVQYCGDIYISDFNELSPTVIDKQEYDITAIGHSMGGMTLEQYVVNCRLSNHPHYLSKAILLSPAGYHHSISIIQKSMLGIFNAIIPKDCTPSSFPVKNSVAHLLVAKILQDLQRTPATLEILNYIASSLIGGESKEWPFQTVNYTRYPLGVCSYHVILQGLHLIMNDIYTMFDYGEEGNMIRYHRPIPPNYANCFEVIDIPMHYIAGKYDTLVPPSDVKRHVDLIQAKHPELATYKEFETAGHLQFTIGLKYGTLDYIMDLLRNPNPIIHYTPVDTDLIVGYTKCNAEGKPYNKNF